MFRVLAICRSIGLHGGFQECTAFEGLMTAILLLAGGAAGTEPPNLQPDNVHVFLCCCHRSGAGTANMGSVTSDHLLQGTQPPQGLYRISTSTPEREDSYKGRPLVTHQAHYRWSTTSKPNNIAILHLLQGSNVHACSGTFACNYNCTVCYLDTTARCLIIAQSNACCVSTWQLPWLPLLSASEQPQAPLQAYAAPYE
jgi:hypothetical protein